MSGLPRVAFLAQSPGVPSAPETVELCVPADVETAEILLALARRYEVVAGKRSSIDRVYLDTFDRRLHAAGLRMWRGAARSAGDGGVRLTLEGAGRPCAGVVAV